MLRFGLARCIQEVLHSGDGSLRMCAVTVHSLFQQVFSAPVFVLAPGRQDALCLNLDVQRSTFEARRRPRMLHVHILCGY